MLAEQPDHVQALLGRHQGAPVALDVADVDQPLDDRRARRRRADARLLHRLAQLLVVDELAGRLHRPEQRRVGVAPRRFGLLALGSRSSRVSTVSPCLELGQLLVGALVLLAFRRGARRRRRPRRRRRASRGRAAACRGCGRRARLALADRRLDARVLEHRLGVEDGEEAARDHVVDAPVVGAHLLERCSERVGMIAWWSVTFSSLTTRASGSRSRPVTYSAPRGTRAALADELGDRLDLVDHVGGQVARVGARVGQRLVLLVADAARRRACVWPRSRSGCWPRAGAS